MKLYLKQKVFSWKDKGTVKNEYGEDVYTIEGEVISFGKKLHIRDASGTEVAFVRQKVMSLLPRFFVEVGGREVAEIVKKLSFLKPKYVVNGLGWDIIGDFFAHDYEVVKNGQALISIHKKWMTWGDTFEIDIAPGTDAVVALAVVLAIDAVMDAQDNAAASS